MNVFFEKVTMPKAMAPADTHCIIPTIFTTFLKDWKHIKELMKGETDAEILQAQKYNLQCAMCQQSVENKQSQIALRLTACKRPGVVWKTKEKCDIVKFAVLTASICERCVKHTSFLNIGYCTIAALRDKSEDILNRMTSNVFTHDVSERITIPYVIDGFLGIFKYNKIEMLHALGKKDSKCLQCQKPECKNRCSGCSFFRFCNDDCIKAAWPEHKEWCRMIRKFESLLYSPIYLKDKK